MVIGVLFSGILAGILGTVGALTLGLPLWVALLLYPVIGTMGSIGFIGLSMPRAKFGTTETSVQFATNLR